MFAPQDWEKGKDISSHHHIHSASQCNRARKKEIKDIYIERQDKRKMIVHVENPKNLQKKKTTRTSKRIQQGYRIEGEYTKINFL